MQGYKYQIIYRESGDWQPLDYAADANERDYLIGYYSLSFGPGYSFQWVELPRQYWPTEKTKSCHGVFTANQAD